MIDYECIFKETISYYFKDNFSLPPMDKIKVNTRMVVATTLDEYLVRLNKGFINVTLEERLERYLVELLKDEWFHQWAPVRWAYATRLLYNPKASNGDIQRALDIIIPLAKDGYPCALNDLAFCYGYGIGVERSYEKAICLWIIASAKGHERARESVKSEYYTGRYKELPEELRLLLLRQVARVLIQENKVGVKDSKLELDGLPLSVSTILKKLDNEQNRLSKTVREKMRLRHCNTLWYNPEDGPYSVGTKWK
jgi:hypothetical protein